jgi:hypothetical protein
MSNSEIQPAGEAAILLKWGEAARGGFQAVPDLLLKHQTTLGLNPTDMTVLLNILMHWWYRDQKPFPRPTTIARRMGSTPRTVQRSIAKLQELGILFRERDAKGLPVLDPGPLVDRLGELAKTDKDYLVRTGRMQWRPFKEKELVA